MVFTRPENLASASYVFIMLVLGVPVWWKTTEVYRVSLPYEDIDELSQTVPTTLKVNLLLVTTDMKKYDQWGPQIQEHLQGSLCH